MTGRESTEPIHLLGVRRWHEDDTTPVVATGRRACGTAADHVARGCVGLSVNLAGSQGLVHLTTEDTLRLSDLLRAMASANPEVER